MKIEVETKGDYVLVNGFRIYPEAKNTNDSLWVDYEIYWKDSRVASFENLSKAIEYCHV